MNISGKDNQRDESVIMLVNSVSRLFRNNVRSEMRKKGLNESYHPILVHLSKNDGLTQQDLVSKTHLTAPSISVTLQKMEADGLIIRETDLNDKRKTIIRLTEKGFQLDEYHRDVFRGQDEECMKNISENEREIIRRGLEKIRENLI